MPGSEVLKYQLFAVKSPAAYQCANSKLVGDALKATVNGNETVTVPSGATVEISSEFEELATEPAAVT